MAAIGRKKGISMATSLIRVLTGPSNFRSSSTNLSSGVVTGEVISSHTAKWMQMEEGSEIKQKDDSGTSGQKKIFVAGATGNTGKRIVEQLLAKGFAVKAGVRDIDKAKTSFPGNNPNLQFVKSDVTEGSTKLADAIGEDSDAVICATGFRPSWDLLSPWKGNHLHKGLLNHWQKFIFNPRKRETFHMWWRFVLVCSQRVLMKYQKSQKSYKTHGTDGAHKFNFCSCCLSKKFPT